MAEDPRLTAENITRQYSRFFFGSTREELWAQALAGLEDKDKIIPCSVAMDWAADAFEAGNVEAAKRGMRIVRALSASY